MCVNGFWNFFFHSSSYRNYRMSKQKKNSLCIVEKVAIPLIQQCYSVTSHQSLWPHKSNMYIVNTCSVSFWFMFMDLSLFVFLMLQLWMIQPFFLHPTWMLLKHSRASLFTHHHLDYYCCSFTYNFGGGIVRVCV